MFEDDVYDAFEFLSQTGKHNTFGVLKDEIKKSDVTNSIPRYVTEHQKTENPRRRQIQEIGVHKGKYTAENMKEWKSSTDENILAHNKPVTSAEKSNDVIESNVDRHNTSPSVSGVIINTPIIQEYENKGFLIKGTQTMKKGKEFVIEKTHDYLGTIYKRWTTEGVTTPYRDDVGDQETPKAKGFFYNISAENKEIGTANYNKKDRVGDAFSVNENQAAKIKILDDAMKDFKMGNDRVNQYLSFGKSNTKKNEEKTRLRQHPISEADFKGCPSDHRDMYKSHDIMTLGDALTYFGLSSYLQKIEMSLEDVRRNRKQKEDHEHDFKQIDKEIQKLSFKYHPDRVKNRGGTEKEIEIAQSLQTAINATRSVLKVLNSAFIEDIGTDHKFGFYTQLSIVSLNNEDEIKYRIYEVIFKIEVISRIKQQNIISEIRKFLIESKNCVDSYLGNINDFEKYRDLALFHLKCCIKGFKKLRAELEEVKEQCKSEKSGENMHSLIENMTRESKRDLRLLKLLKKTAKVALEGKYQFFSPVEFMDPYFVLPLVSYTNVILMCNVMVRSSSLLDRLKIHSELDPYFRDDLGYLMHPYYLASYCSGNKYHENTVLKIMDKVKLIQQGFKIQISKEEIESEFYKCMEQIKEFMEFKFKTENYNEAITTSLLALDLKKCMTMMTEFQEKKQELSKGIKDFQNKTEKMDEKYERFDKIMQASEELNQKVQERLEQSKKLSEKISKALSDQI